MTHRSTPGRVAAALAAVIVTTGLAACGSSGDDGGDGKNITFWSSQKPEVIKYLQDQFNKTHKGIHVTGQYIASSDQLAAKEVSSIKSGEIANVVVGQDPASVPFLAQSGKVVDLKNDLKTETAALYPGIREGLSYKGKQLSFALGGVGNYVLFYNKDDFKAAGIAAPPSTWQEVVQDAIKLTNPAKKKYGIYIPLGAAEWISYSWEGLFWANGGKFLSDDGKKVDFDSKAGVDALTTWVDLVDKYKAAPSTSYAQAGSYDGAPAFAGKNVSMIIEGQFALQPFREAKVNFGVAPFPAGTSGKSATGIGVGVASVFDHGSKANKSAIEFVKWLGQPAQGAYLTGISSGLPSAPNQLQLPAVRKLAASDPTYKVFSQQLQTGQSRPTIPAYSAISTALSTQIYDALRGKISPSAALKKAADEANKALKANS